MRQETTEDDLQNIMDMYEDLVSTIPVGVYRFRMKAGVGWQFDFVNSRFCELTGLNREDILNNYETVFSLIHPDDFPEFISLIKSVEKNPAPFGWKGRIMVDGQSLWMSLESNPTLMDTGDIVWSGYLNDITARKRAEESLRESEKRWEFALEGARDGVWDWNAQTNEVFFSKQWKAMLGYREHEIGTTLDEWAKRLHPDDAERCYADLERHFVGETPFYENEHRVLCKDGSYKWILDRGKVIEWADDGKPLRVVGTHSDLTERKRMEDELRESRKNFLTFFETIDDMIVVANPDGRIMYANPAVSHKLGYTPDELKTMHILDVNPRTQRQEAEGIFSEMLKGVRTTCPLPAARRDGTIIPTETRVWLGKWSCADAMFGICKDLSKEQEALQKFNKLFELNPTPMAVSSLPDRKLIEVNGSWLATLGFSRDEVIGRTPGDLGIWVYPEKQQEFAKRLQKQSVVRDTELQIRKKDGGIVEGLFSGAVIDSQGEKFLITVMLDVTDRKRLEQEQLEIERKLLHAQKLESLAVMAGGIAHDFNNQLAVVLGNLELALMDLTPDDIARPSVNKALGAAKRSAELSRQMQTYTGNILYYPVTLDLNELLNSNLSMLKLCGSNHVILKLETRNALPSIRGDADQIQNLVMNILANSFEAIGDKDGEIRLSTGIVECDEAYLSHSNIDKKPQPGRFVFLEVSDTGCGMNTETVRKLFDPFFSTKFWGRGLGMAEVVGIVKSHNGVIMVDSEVGKGTTIRVMFPASKKLQPPFIADRISVEKTESQVPDTARKRKTILVVDDEELVRYLVKRRLEVLGHRAITASDGEEGVRIFRERMNEIDLVMLDFAMPRMNGVEAFEELIRIKPEVNVILSSGYTEEVLLRYFPGQRPAGVLHKPYKMEELKAQLERLLGKTG